MWANDERGLNYTARKGVSRMPNKTAAQVAEKWNRRLKGSTQDIEAGINAVTSAPTQAAAAKIDKMRANIVKAIDSGKVQAGLSRVSLQDWKDKTLRKGVPRISQGADEAQGKVQSFMGELLPYIDNVKAQVKSMPDMTIEDSVNRVATFIRGMSNFKRSK